MKCPYNGFKDCIVQECPHCVYEEETIEVTEGRYPNWMSEHAAIEQGNAWKEKRKRYKFVSCGLADAKVQPPSIVSQTVNNDTRSSVVIMKKSLI